MPSRQDPPARNGKIQWKGQANTVGARLAVGVTGRWFCDAKPAALMMINRLRCLRQSRPGG